MGLVDYISNPSEFNTITRNSNNKLIVVDFTASWCGPCQAIAPFFEELAGEYGGRARFIKVDVDQAQEIAQSCGVTAMPTFHFYRGGRCVEQIRGADPNGLRAATERHAPSQAEVSFSGAGHTLGGGGSSSAGPPKVNWDSPDAQEEVRKRREAIAAAASQRFTSQPTVKEDEKKAAKQDEEPKNEIVEQNEAPKNDVAMEDNTDAADESAEKPTEKANDPRLKVDQALLQQMMEMGFPKIRAEKALILTQNKSLEPAMEWCFEHADDPDVDEPLAMVAEDGTPKVQLSAEERRTRANEALAKARAKREEIDKQTEHQRERDRIRSGKEIAAARRAHEDAERKRAIEKKRLEKLEAAREKKRVQELLAADRAARREKYGRGGASPPAVPAPSAPTQPAKPPAPATGGKLQLRFADGSRLEPHFEPQHTLSDVVDAIVAEKPGVVRSSVKMATMYPRRVFTEADYGTSLTELKLIPRGVLNVSL